MQFNSALCRGAILYAVTCARNMRKKELDMKRKSTILSVTIFFVLTLVLLCGCLASCGGEKIYYRVKNGNYDYEDYIKIDGDTWEDAGGTSGTVEKSGDTITLYVNIFGEQEVYLEGTLQKGVLTYHEFGETYTYALEGKAPAGTQTSSENGSDGKIYYRIEGGGYNFEDYIKIDGSAWKNSDGLYGTVEMSGDVATFYIYGSSGKQKYLEGTLQKGVLTYTEANQTQIYAIRDKDDLMQAYGYVRCTKDNTPNINGEYLLFGEYPQTLKKDNVAISDVADSRGYYRGSDECFYAKVTATPYGSGYQFSNGSAVTSGTTYYFKVEPIRWRILNEENGKAFLICDNIIANQRYDDNSNNYADSEIRTWLNRAFYTIAFSSLQQALIQITKVDNSAASTGYIGNSFACADTDDKVFLLSYKEVTNSDYDTARGVQTSDYARGSGAYISTDKKGYGNGLWWLRSPFYYTDYGTRIVTDSGYVGSSNREVNYPCGGCVPALWISL